MVGWLELQLCHGRETSLEKAFAQKTDALFRSFEKYNIFPVRNLSHLLMRRLLKPFQTIGTIAPPDDSSHTRKITVNRPVEISPAVVQPSQYVSEVIDRHGSNGSIAVVHCFCRQWRRLVNDPCRFDIKPETCMVLGPIALHVAEHGFGRLIHKKDALDILEEVSKAGAVHTMYHQKDDTALPHIAICNCCWDCCAIYGGFNRGLLPLYFQSYYEARMTEPNTCTGCVKCVRHCPTGAIVINGKTAKITSARCIGCGQCALQCPASSVTLFPNRRNVLVPVPKRGHARIKF